ncbi:MAG TPA: oxidoreductase [Patescibacteria group bacterium]|nr:oxidoreductase [Patescibacteria group bacterium]
MQNPIIILDKFLNSITMYRLILYGLIAMVIYSLAMSFLGFIPFNWLTLFTSLIILLLTCFITNFTFGKLLKATNNQESYLITALILYFVIAPATNFSGGTSLIYAAIFAIASKFIFAIRKRHIFNPVAISALILGLTGMGYAIWWVGSLIMLPITLAVGLLVVRKIRRFQLFFAFVFISLLTMVFFGSLNHRDAFEVIKVAVLSYPVIFFGTIMLTEPSTTPPTKNLRTIYAILVGIIFGSQFKIGPLTPTPEFALVIGNVFSYLVTNKQKLFLTFESKKQIAKDTYEFIFTGKDGFNFNAGQYLEWTLPNVKINSRGNRRYFTIASSPAEDKIKLGLKVFPDSSPFKKKLLDLKAGDQIIGNQLSGDFVLPKGKNEKLVFIAGGIGITPFRSIIEYLLDKKETRPITLFYSNKTTDEITYKDILDRAIKELGIKTIYLLGDNQTMPKDNDFEIGRLNVEMIKKYVNDCMDRTFYISGPEAMVNTYRKLLKSMGIKNSRIKVDYFPGF